MHGSHQPCIAKMVSLLGTIKGQTSINPQNRKEIVKRKSWSCNHLAALKMYNTSQQYKLVHAGFEGVYYCASFIPHILHVTKSIVLQLSLTCELMALPQQIFIV